MNVNNGEFYIDEDGSIVICDKHISMRIANDDAYIIDEYGNEMSITGLKAIFTPNAPTYDELYGHWLWKMACEGSCDK